MTEDQAALIRESFSRIAPIAQQAGALFYGRLFELDPALRPLFKSGSIDEQARKLMATLSFAVSNLSNPDVLIPAVQQLGERHRDYGVTDKDYDTVGEAFLWTLGQGLGDSFTPEVKLAWTECYATLASVMKEAAQRTTSAA
jgi:nitric oxide dioxygenase